MMTGFTLQARSVSDGILCDDDGHDVISLSPRFLRRGSGQERLGLVE